VAPVAPHLVMVSCVSIAVSGCRERILQSPRGGYYGKCSTQLGALIRGRAVWPLPLETDCHQAAGAGGQG
jgi:hypothetical protein